MFLYQTEKEMQTKIRHKRDYFLIETVNPLAAVKAVAA